MLGVSSLILIIKNKNNFQKKKTYLNISQLDLDYTGLFKMIIVTIQLTSRF